MNNSPKHFYYLDGESIRTTDSPLKWSAIERKSRKKWQVRQNELAPGVVIETRFTGIDARETYPDLFGHHKSPLLWRTTVVRDGLLLSDTYCSGSFEGAEAVHYAILKKTQTSSSYEY
jgi:hypothetical protein